MHYRNGREAKNGDKIVQIGGYGNGAQITAVGVLYDAVPGNDYCNGQIAPTQMIGTTACLCDCLHVDDVAKLLAGFSEFSFHFSPNTPDGTERDITVFRAGTSDRASFEEIDALLQRLNAPGLDKRPPGK